MREVSGGKKYRVVIELSEDSPYLLDESGYYRRLDGSGRSYDKKRKPPEKPPSTKVLLGYFTIADLDWAIKTIAPGSSWLRKNTFCKKTREAEIIVTLYDGCWDCESGNPAPRDLTVPEHRALLRLSNRGVSGEKCRRISDVMFALGGPHMRIQDKNGRLLGYQREADFMLGSWGYEVDEESATIQLPWGFEDAERAEWLIDGLSAKGVPKYLAEEMRAELDRIERANLKIFAPLPKIEWNRILRLVNERLQEGDHDYRASAHVMQLIRRQTESTTTDGLRSSLEASMRRLGIRGVTIGGEAIGSKGLLVLVAKVDRDAVRALTDVLVEAYESRHKPTEGKANSSGSDEAKDREDDLPEWAKPQKSMIQQWAEKTSGANLSGLEGEICGYIVSQVGQGTLNVLVFDSELYQMVVEADMEGEPSGCVEEFPFPLSVVPIYDVPGVYGIAVFRWNDIEGNDGYANRQYGQYGVIYILRDGGATFNPGANALAIGDRLVTYLDCESVQFDTAYVDMAATTPQKRSKADKESTAEEPPDYSIGADFMTGTRIVKERRHSKDSSAIEKVMRRSHFRRGFFRRQRKGARGSWHYETVWIKPTFVHGGKAVVTERKVKRIIL